jgi:hypothetical protein
MVIGFSHAAALHRGVLTGILTVFFDISYQAYLPALVSRRHLVEEQQAGDQLLAAQVVPPSQEC